MGSVRNTIRGDVTGSVVQARDVHGDISGPDTARQGSGTAAEETGSSSSRTRTGEVTTISGDNHGGISRRFG
ncbi:hypothetical protein ACWGJ2_37155 [Streptomyces sp. NPDC054796]